MRGLCLMAIRNHRQTDDLWAGFKVPAWRTFCRLRTLQIHPARFNQVYSDSTRQGQAAQMP